MKQENKKISAREAALLILQKAEQDQAYINLLLRQMLDKYHLSLQDKHLATELVYGCMRMQAALNYCLEQLLSRPLKKLTPAIANILRIGLYQIIYMERIPDSAAVNTAVDLAKRYGHKGTASLVNGVLRSYLRAEQPLLPKEDQGREYFIHGLSYPDWLVDELLKLWPKPDINDFLKFHNQHHGITVRYNSLKISKTDFVKQLEAKQIDFSPAKFSPSAFILHNGSEHLKPFLTQGLILAQGEASQLVAYACNPQPGQTIIDLCAAPGGKASHLAQLMDNKGRIIANDIHASRVQLIKDNAAALGIDIIETICADGCNLPDKYHNLADTVLLDAPCSGLGVLGKRADSRWRKSKDDINQMQALSANLLQAAGRYLKPKGYLIFSTCTIMPAENEENIKAFLAANPNFKLVSIINLADLLLDEDDKKAALAGMIQLLPQKQNLEGFFIAKMQKD